jgi:SAM-dependent methyltransferase
MDHVEWFDTAYKTGDYRRHWDVLTPSAELVSFVATGLIPADGKCIDVGCGAGTEAVFLAQCGYRAVGIDLSGEALRIAKTRAEAAGVSVDWRVGSALDLPVRDGSVEFANDRGCFHHIPEKQRGRYGAEMARVLKPGGSLLLRGCRSNEGQGAPFILVDRAAVESTFGEHFSWGPILPLEAYSDAGQLPCNVVILERR